ncbi:MAG TPA: hypothetical protein VMD99_04280 [Terriglobales bacterium]|nr:hypothetical protein [Terriglobales bacterium]
MSAKKNQSSAPSAGSAKKAKNISINQLPVEQARANLRMLLLANPNYFGNLEQSGLKPVLNIAGDTAYEELGCVGFSLALSRLEAVVSIKQTTGYEGGVCTNGSQEYVRFYLSFDGGTTWQDQGVAGFTVYDIPGPKPLEYSVALPVTLPEDICFIENLPQVRAILSWNFIPPANTPGYSPVWGNVVDVTIQSPAWEFIIFENLLALSKVQLPANVKQAVDLTQKIAAAPKKALSATELAELYNGTPVPAARFLYPEIVKVSESQGSTSLASVATGKGKSALDAINVNLGDVVGSILSTSGNTDYEQLDCVGLDTNRSTLVGVVNVKLPYGFNGGLCTAGSTEYVAFWVDWGSGYQYEGTATINTHDISDIPADGLDYAAVLPIDLASHMQPCTNGAQTANVRAILSWQTPPPPTDPNYVPVWGNQENALVQIPSGQPVQAGVPNIAIIGGIGVAQIDTTGATARPGTTLPGAVFALQGTPADPYDSSRQCPFGQEIVVQGLPSVGFKYRAWVQDVSLPLPIPLTHSIVTTDQFGNPTTQFPDPEGFFTYLPNSQNIDNNLAYWYSNGNDLYNLWLEIADLSDNVLGRTVNYLIQLVNTQPIANINLASGGDCKQFNPSTTPTLNGVFVATEVGTGTTGQIGHYSLETLPSGNAPVPSSGISDTGAAGAAWSLSLTSPAVMPPCGYVVLLDVWDNTIVNSAPGNWNGNSGTAGFCVVSGD